MADIVSKEQRTYIMSRIRGKDTKLEVALRSMLHGMGYRFTVNSPRNKRLPGRPDIVLPKYDTVIFMHGCFWHGHENCPGFQDAEIPPRMVAGEDRRQQGAGRTRRGGASRYGLARCHHLGLCTEKHPRPDVAGGTAPLTCRLAAWGGFTFAEGRG